MSASRDQPAATPPVQVEGFRKLYRDVVAVDGISFDAQPGEIFGLLGPNGAGKTSTLECLEGLRAPDSGTLRVGGIDPSTEPRRLRSVIGVQLQSAGLPDTITPEEAMRLFCAYHGIPPRFDLLDRIGLQEKRGAQYSELSGGQQRRLALAIAVAHEPEVLFLDEPTAGLDVASRVELHDLMRERQEAGATILLATHDMAEAEEMADRVAILLHGRLAAIGSPRELTAKGAGLTRISVHTLNDCLGVPTLQVPAVSRNAQDGHYRIFFSTDIGPTVAAIISHVEAHDDTLIDLRVERPSLEERFLEITGTKQQDGESAR